MLKTLQVVSVAMIQGGTAFNVIPDSASISGTFRAFSKKSFFSLRDRIEQVIDLFCLVLLLLFGFLSCAFYGYR